MATKNEVMDKLSTVDDPELAMNIVDLGLVYEVDVDNPKRVNVRRSLATGSCPLMGHLMNEIDGKVKELGFEEVNVELVWDPPWSPEMMTERAKAMLGVF